MVEFREGVSQLYAMGIQNPNLWEFSLDDPSFSDIKYRVVSTSLPFLNFEVGTHNSGLRYFKSYTPEEQFNITFWETKDFRMFRYLDTWQREIYDPKRRIFNSGNHTKTGFLTFSRHIVDLASLVSGAVGVQTGSAEKQTIQFTLKKLLLIDMSAIDLNYTNDAAGLQITGTFVAQSIEWELLDLPSKGANLLGIQTNLGAL